MRLRMARPSKYNWEAIKEAYEGGIDKDSIVKKFKVQKKLLNNKISENKWQVKGHIDSDIKGFSDSLGALAQNGTKHPEIADIIADKINTQLEDNKIIKGNRKLFSAFQGIIGQGIRQGLYKTASDISQGVNAVSRIESSVNPQSNRTEINNTNAQQTNLTVNEISAAVANGLPD